MIDSLINLGLSRAEAEVYKALIDLQPCFVAPIVKQVKKHRQIIYNSLATLEERGLVSVGRKNGKNFYSLSNPNQLLIDLKKKEVLAEDIARQILEKQNKITEQAEIFPARNYEEGITLFRKLAEESREYIVVRGETQQWFQFTSGFFDYHVEELRRIKGGGIQIAIVFFENEKEMAQKYIGPHAGGQPYDCKIITEEYRLPYTFWLAGDNVFVLTPVSDPLIIHIKSSQFARQHREYFWKTWKKGYYL